MWFVAFVFALFAVASSRQEVFDDNNINYDERSLDKIGFGLIGRSLDRIGGGSLVGRSLDGIGRGGLVGRNLDSIGGGGLVGRSLDGIGGGGLVGRSLDGIGRGGLVGRSVDRIGSGIVRRCVDSIGGCGNIVRRSSYEAADDHNGPF